MSNERIELSNRLEKFRRLTLLAYDMNPKIFLVEDETMQDILDGMDSLNDELEEAINNESTSRD